MGDDRNGKQGGDGNDRDRAAEQFDRGGMAESGERN
jgi:hypothetical protein